MNVKKVIKDRHYTITQVAEKVGVSRVTLVQNLDRNPTYNTLKRIADAIGCTVGEFFRDELEPPSDGLTCPHCGKPISVKIEQ